jgi:hypothetical protein
MRNVSVRKTSKASCEKSAKYVPGKKSAKRQVLSRAATQQDTKLYCISLRHGKRLFSRFLNRF